MKPKNKQDYIDLSKKRKNAGDIKYWDSLPLLPLKELRDLKEGTVVICGLNGKRKTKGIDYIDEDTRRGVTAWAIDIL